MKVRIVAHEGGRQRTEAVLDLNALLSFVRGVAGENLAARMRDGLVLDGRFEVRGENRWFEYLPADQG